MNDGARGGRTCGTYGGGGMYGGGRDDDGRDGGGADARRRISARERGRRRPIFSHIFSQKKTSMEDFTTATRQSRMCSALLIGANFGIFLTIGKVWSDVIHACVAEILPQNEDAIVRELINATLTSCFGLVFVFCLLKLDASCAAMSRRLRPKPVQLARENIAPTTTTNHAVPRPRSRGNSRGHVPRPARRL